MSVTKEHLEQENAELKAQLSLLASSSQHLASDFNSGPTDDEIDLRELWTAIWKGKWIIVVITAFFMVAGMLYAQSKPNEYRSTAILVPASTSSTSSLSKFAGLASLAGINLGGSNSVDKSAIAIGLIKTWGFLEDFVRTNNLEVEVLAVKGWEKLNNRLLIDEAIYDEGKSSWMGVIDPKQAGSTGPSGWQLFGGIVNRINIDQDKKTGFIMLSVEHYSPFVAKRWTDLLVVAINRHIQQQDRKEAQNSIEYLKEQINKTSIAEMRTIFYQLIEEQTKTLMLAEISSEYALKTLSPAKVPEQRSKPKRTQIVMLTTVMGGILSVLFSLVLFYIRKRYRN